MILKMLETILMKEQLTTSNAVADVPTKCKLVPQEVHTFVHPCLMIISDNFSLTL